MAFFNIVAFCMALIVSSKAVADAYYVLSDKTRRREYDTLYASRPKNDRTNDPTSSTNFFANFANMFAGAAGSSASAGAGAAPPEGEQPNAEGVFADVFDDVSSDRLVFDCIH
jgi:DnaJ-class molecular chaperone